MMGIKIKPNYVNDGVACRWETPKVFYDKLDKEFNFTLDPCCIESNAKCKKFYTPKEDGLKQDWSKDIVFMNPPYNKYLSSWVKKAYEESLKGAIVVCLIPANRSDTKWWWDYCMKGEIRFIKGRLKFKGRNTKGELVNYPATFPSAIVIFKSTIRKETNEIVGVAKMYSALVVTGPADNSLG